VSKLAGEFYLNYYNLIRGLEYVALRYSNVYGPRQDPHGEAGVVAIFCERLLEGRPLTIYGDGEQTRDYVFVSDVVRANLAATDLPLKGSPPANGTGIDRSAFNVGTSVETSVNGLADLLEEVAGVRPGREHKDARPGELRNSSLDRGRFAQLGWEPVTHLREGLRKTYEHIARTRGQR
jgi:UDP-glucose 4-epimerase